MVCALIMPRSATTQTRPMEKRWRRRSITGMSVVTAVGARNDQSMQDGQKDVVLDRELETPSPEKLLDNGPAAGLAPQPIKQQRSADAPAVEIHLPEWKGP